MTALRCAACAAFGVLAAAAAWAGVDINRANQAELEAVRGVGTSLAARILDERNKAPFKDWADFVARVEGVGAGNARRLSAAGLTVEGAAYGAKAPAAASAPKP